MHWLHNAPLHALPPKAAVLARLKQADLPVPPGFVLTPREAEVLTAMPSPPEAAALRLEIGRAYRRLREQSGGGLVAVRSAGPQEDSQEASFAGQYETHLNIPDENALLGAITACALSGESERLLVYQDTLAPESRRSPGVIVQSMIQPQTAGMLFTIHPITGDKRFLLIEATPGLGEALANGLETPARLTFSREGKAHTMLSLEHLPPPFRAADFWQPLLHMALKIEDLLGGAQDIEWAYAEGQFWILQARPITVQPASEPPPDASRWTRANIGEVLNGVVTPLTWSTFIHVLRQAEDPRRTPRPSEMARLFNGRAYMRRQDLWDSYANVWGIRPEVVLGRGIGCQVQDTAALRAAQAQPPFKERLVKNAYVWGELLTLSLVRPKLENNLSALGPQLVFLTEESPRSTVGGHLRKHLRATLAVTRQTFQAHMQASFLAFCAYAATWQSLEKAVGAEAADQWMASYSIASKDKVLWNAHLTALVRKVHETPVLNDLFRRQTGNALLESLSDVLEGRAFLDEIRRRARRMGDRAAQEFELRTPRWSEDVQTLVGAVQARLLASGHPTQPIPRKLRHSLTLNPTRRMGLLGRRKFLRLRKAFTVYTHMRERTKSLLMACFGELRRVALASGKRLYERGYLNHPEDVFFLELEELDNLLVGQYTPDLPENILRRQRQHAYHEEHHPSGAGENTAEENTLYGTAVSSGRVTGRVRVVRDPSQARLLPGEILVTEATDPGWMPLFVTAAGIVTEIGGLLSHTATLARELGKPAVFAVPEATRRLHDGQQITVDGWSGSIEIAPLPPEGL